MITASYKIIVANGSEQLRPITSKGRLQVGACNLLLASNCCFQGHWELSVFVSLLVSALLTGKGRNLRFFVGWQPTKQVYSYVYLYVYLNVDLYVYLYVYLFHYLYLLQRGGNLRLIMGWQGSKHLYFYQYFYVYVYIYLCLYLCLHCYLYLPQRGGNLD